MDRIVFEGWVKTIVSNLFDLTILETHPVTSKVVHVPPHFNARKGEYVRKITLEAIEQLKPPDLEPSPSLPQWRPYIILSKRYVNGLSLQEVATELSISDRQLRRDQHRALQALASRLWDILITSSGQETDQFSEVAGDADPFQFAIHREVISFTESIQGVLDMLRPRMVETGVQVEGNPSEGNLSVITDRIILRQVLISLFTGAIQTAEKGIVRYIIAEAGPEISLSIRVPPPENQKTSLLFEETTRETLKEWAERMGAQLFIQHTHPKTGEMEIRLALPRADRKTLLVVDDQPSSIQMFQRFLHKSDLMVVGETHPEQVVATATRLQPEAIILDVMMPQVDGWEVLQALRLNEETASIPILICSAWVEPELARSLGAAGFIKKPLTQKVLLTSLTELGLQV